jgi:hypothetical protein
MATREDLQANRTSVQIEEHLCPALWGRLSPEGPVCFGSSPVEGRVALKRVSAQLHRVAAPARCPGTARRTAPGRREPAGPASWTYPRVARCPQGIPRSPSVLGPCACVPDAARNTFAPTPCSTGWSAPVPRPPAARRCSPLATAAAGSAAPPPVESFEAYHPSHSRMLCITSLWNILVVQPFFDAYHPRPACRRDAIFEA